ncbi:MAG: hypothetical protein RIT30_203 [Bacteroidota bacterium]
MSLSSIQDFLEPINIAHISNDEGYRDTQLGKHIKVNEGSLPDITDADIVIIGAGECRGAGYALHGHTAANAVRTALYDLYYWHAQVNVVDIGNVKIGQSIQELCSTEDSDI